MIPVYNDWKCVRILLSKLDAELTNHAIDATLLLVDDYSPSPAPEDYTRVNYNAIQSVECLRLSRNLGHQRAIAVGVSFIHDERPCDAIVVMDADGEDKPEDVPRLVNCFRESGGGKVIFAERVRRSEGLPFRAGYMAYRFLHRGLTGIAVRFGNFSIVPHASLSALVVCADMWNHYAASVLKLRLPFASLPTTRGDRYFGKSNLNYVGLVMHGLSGISVFAETIGVRVILWTLSLVTLGAALLLGLVGLRIFQPSSVPNWATNAIGFTVVILLQLLVVAFAVTLFMLFSRNNLNFIPSRDYRLFVGTHKKLYQRHECT